MPLFNNIKLDVLQTATFLTGIVAIFKNFKRNSPSFLLYLIILSDLSSDWIGFLAKTKNRKIPGQKIYSLSFPEVTKFPVFFRLKTGIFYLNVGMKNQQH